MFRNATPEKAIAFTQFMVALTCYWPPPSTATKSQILAFKMLRSVLFVHAFLLFFPLLYALYVHRDDAVKLCKVVSLLLAVIQVLLLTVFGATRQGHLQRLIEETKFCCEIANSYERRVLQRYMNKYATFYGVSGIWFYSSAVIVVLGTFFISDPFPTNAEYPFPVDFEPLRSIIFVHQGIVGLQCAAHVCVNIFCALLLLFAAARFEILMNDLRAISDARSLIKCINKYYVVKRYATEVVNTVRFVALTTVTLCGMATVLYSINYMERHPFTVKVQFVCLTATALLEVFMCAWPADHLMDASENVMQAAFGSKWYQRSLRIQKSMLFMMIPQPPMVVKVCFMVPALSLNFYCSYITNAFSLFTALRIVMLKEESEN